MKLLILSAILSEFSLQTGRFSTNDLTPLYICWSVFLLSLITFFLFLEEQFDYLRPFNFKLNYSINLSLFETPDYDASAAFFQVFSLPGAFQFSLMRKGWYICRGLHKDYHRTEIVTDYNMADTAWLKRCSFALRPLAANENAQMNCFDTLQPPKPSGIPGISSPQTTISTPPQTNKTTPTTPPVTTNPTTPHKHDGK